MAKESVLFLKCPNNCAPVFYNGASNTVCVCGGKIS